MLLRSYSFIPRPMKNHLFSALFLCSFSLSAQHYFGPSLFAGFSDFIQMDSDYQDQFSPLFVAGVGFNYEYRLNERSRIVSGLNYNSKGNKWTPAGWTGNNLVRLVRFYYLSFQVPLMYQYRFRSGKNNAWLVAAGVSASFTTSKYTSNDTESGFVDESYHLKEYGNVFIPSALLSIGYSQALKKNRAIVYSLVYDQNLDTYYPGYTFRSFLNYNLGVSVSFLFSSGK